MSDNRITAGIEDNKMVLTIHNDIDSMKVVMSLENAKLFMDAVNSVINETIKIQK